MLVTPFVQYFGAVPDPRIDRTKQHMLLDILVIALCAVICGAEGWEDMEAFGRAKEAFLREHLGLELPAGIPSHDTFRRVFARLDPDVLHEQQPAGAGGDCGGQRGGDAGLVDE